MDPINEKFCGAAPSESDQPIRFAGCYGPSANGMGMGGALWIVDREAGLLGCQSSWHATDIEHLEFDTIKEEKPLIASNCYSRPRISARFVSVACEVN